MDTTIRIGTRGSKLALWQAHYVQAELEKLGLSSSITIISTKGDRIQDLSFDKIEGKGFFTKEIEDALLKNEVDLAVHSMKDLPTSQPEGLVVTAVSYRENPADLLLIHPDAHSPGHLLGLPQNAKVGTSSARRKAQLLHYRPDLELLDLRGNVPTRIDKLRSGGYQAIMLASAGIERLGLDLSDLVLQPLNPKEFVPAPAQGVLAFQVRENDTELRRKLQGLHHREVASCTNVERKVLQLTGGGCHAPLGAYCERDEQGNYHLWAAWAKAWDAPVKIVRLSSTTSFELAENAVSALRNLTGID